MPIRVRQQSTYYPHWAAHSGFVQLARYLDPAKYVVRSHAASDNDDDLPILHEGLRQRLRERVQRRGMNWYKLSDLAAELRALPGCLLGMTDIIHFLDGEHCPQYLPLLLKRSRWCRTKIVTTYHQPPDLLGELLSPEVVARVDRITVVSPTQISYFQQYLPPERINLILHGVNTDFFAPAVKPPAQSAFRCVTTGHWLRDWKAFRRVAEELQSDGCIEFHVVTNRETGLEGLPNVFAHRDIDDIALLALYQQADALFLPLTQSTANNSLLEGIACGLPVVSTFLPAVQAYLSGKEAILVKENDPKELAEAILYLINHPTEREIMSKEARKRALELDWRNIAREYEAIYSKMVDPE